MPRGENATCLVCARLSESELRELDRLLSDPGKWPASLWDAIGRPAKMTPSARRFGQIGMGEAWLQAHGFENLDRRAVATHVRNHIATVPDLGEMFAAGAPEGALLLMDFWAKALDAGAKALGKLIAKMDQPVAEGEPEPFSISQLLEIAEFSSRLAASASRGKTPFQAEPPQLPPQLPASSDTGFMGALPSPRAGHHRQRIVEGVPRIVTDEGPRDRELYNERADQEGSPRL